MATIHIIRVVHASNLKHEAIAVTLHTGDHPLFAVATAVAQSTARLPIEKNAKEFNDLVDALKLLWCNESNYTEGGLGNWHFTYRKVVR